MPLGNSPSMKNMDSKMPMIIGIALVIILLIAIFAMRGTNQPSPTITSPNQATAPTQNVPSVKDLVQKIASKGVPIKQDEVPIVAQIKDVNSLRTANPTFYKDAQDGDLIYIWSDRVALYSVPQDKLLQFMALIPEPGQTVTPQTVPIVVTPGASVADEAATVQVENGATPSMSKEVVDKLKAAKLTVLPATQAKAQAPKTLIMPVRLDRPMGNTLKLLQQLTGGEFVPPNPAYGPFKGDVVVIIGADYK